MTKPQDIDIALRITLEGLQELEGVPHNGANGCIHFLLKEIARLCLNKRQQQHMAEIVLQHRMCVHGRAVIEASEAEKHDRMARMARGDDPTATVAGDEQPGSTTQREHVTRALLHLE